MVVVRIKTDGRTRRLRFDRTFTLGTTPGCDVFLGAWRHDVAVTVTVADPDVRLDPSPEIWSLTLNDYDVDSDFVHVLHVGDKLGLAHHEILFELVAGTPLEVRRVLGEAPTAPDPAEQEVLEALRADPADPVAREVYADWLDMHERCSEAELVRLQWLPDGKRVTDPAAFSSEWMSHQSRAIQLRLRDLAQLSDPARRALSSRPMMMCRYEGCPQRWEALEIRDTDTIRYCGRCKGTVEFCSTFARLSSRGNLRLPVAVDPILVHEVATRTYYHPTDELEEPTDPFIAVDD